MGTFFNRDTFKTRLLELMSDNNDTTYSLAEYLGLSPATISRYTTGNIEPKLPTIQAIAEKYNVNPKWLMGQPGESKYIDSVERSKKIPIVGTIACGEPIIAQQYIEGIEYVAEDVNVDFALRVKGDSMIGARILDGDLVYIRQQPDVENGEIAAVLIDNEEATLKRVYKINGNLILRAENPAYPDRIFSKREARAVKILGKAIMFKSVVR